MGVFLKPEEVQALKSEHKLEEKRRYADRIKVILGLDAGHSVAELAKLLLLDEKTIRRYRELYELGGIEELCTDAIVGKQSKLSPVQTEALKTELRTKVYPTTAAIIEHVGTQYGVRYSTSGMAELLHRIGFSYKKPKVIPGKADAQAQEKFLETLAELKRTKGAENPLYYADGVHPQHNSMPAYGWMPRGEETKLKTNTGRKRVNLSGALNAETKELVVSEHLTLNTQSTLDLFVLLESLHPGAEKIYLIVDNAGYYRSKEVKQFLLTSRVVLVFLPPYAPNLNLIERVWKFFKKKQLANQYYEKYATFREACLEFFKPENWLKLRSEWQSLLSDNFHIIDAH